MIESLSIAVHAFVSRVSMSFSVDETRSVSLIGMVGLNDIGPKLNVILWLQFEFAYDNNNAQTKLKSPTALLFVRLIS